MTGLEEITWRGNRSETSVSLNPKVELMNKCFQVPVHKSRPEVIMLDVLPIR